MESMVMLKLLTDTYRNKKIFLTGHTGFKGSWFLAILNLLQANVKGYALEPDVEPSLFKLLKGEKLCQSVIADIRNEKKIIREILSFEPDYIFHFAAQPIVRKSYIIPVETYDVNVIGTVKVLEALRKLKKKCNAVMVTTDKVYENKETDYGYKESDNLGGWDPYSASKACAEIVCSSYRLSFFNPTDFKIHKKSIATARSGNVIGGGDWVNDRIIPDLVRAFTKNKKLIVRNPQSVRPWQHVLDPLYGYLLLGARLNENPIKFADSFNFGPYLDDKLSVEELVKNCITHWGSGKYEIEDNKNDLHEANLLQLDILKAKNELGWKPRYSSGEAIEKTINWYKNYHSNPLEFTKNQIKKYFELL